MNGVMRAILGIDTEDGPSLPTLDDAKERYVVFLFEATKHDLRETARILNVSPRTVHDKISTASSLQPCPPRA